MKKLLIAIGIVAASISSCKKDDKSVFDKSPDERINEKLAAYQAQLSGAQDGWKGVLVTDSGRGSAHSFYFKFNNENRVIMLSDFDSLSAVTLKESSYRLKALQQPSLIFDTYSYLHVLADPDGAVNGGPVGAGLFSDFEFYFDAATTDSIKLVGRFNASKMTLVRATKAEADAYGSGQLAAGLNINKILTYFKRLTIGSQLYDVKIDAVNRQFVFSWLDGSGNLQTFSTGYYFTAGGVVFTTPFTNGSQTISGFNNITWTQATETINLMVNNTSATITGIVVPLKVDLTAPQRWYNFALTDPDFFSASANGFHKNGIDDFFNVRSISSYALTIYYPQYQPVPPNNELTDYFAMLYVVNNQLSFTNSFGPLFTLPTINATTGILKFNLSGYVRNPPANLGADQAKALQILTDVRTQMAQSPGYYFVETGENIYDMVSAFDGKSWITWEPF